MSARRFSTALSLAAALAAGIVTGPAGAQEAITFAAGPQGSANYIVASGIGTVLARHSDLRVTVVPYQGTTTLLPAVARGEAPVGANDAGSVYQGYAGTGQFDTAHPNLRLLSSGSMNQVAIAVRADSDIRTADDLRGKRVTARFAALPVCQIHAEATLANLGLSWDDVRQVPVTNIVQAAQALGEGRVDAMLCAAPGIAALREIHARTPLRFIGIDGSPEAMERARAHYTYNAAAQTLPADAFGWLPNEAAFLAYPWYLYAAAELDEGAVRTILGVMWDHNDELKDMHPILRAWTPEAMVTREPVLPYHPAAAAFYADKGVWPAELDQAQKALLGGE